MKYVLLISLSILFIIPSSLFGSGDTLSVDIKTKLVEKLDLASAKLGLIEYLSQVPNIKIVEIDEKYTIWLRNYNSSIDGDLTTISVEIEIRTPAEIRTGKLIKKTTLKRTYGKNDQLSLDDNSSYSICTDCIQESNFIGYYSAIETIKMLRDIEPDISKELKLYQK